MKEIPVPALVKEDPWLAPYTPALLRRIKFFEIQQKHLEKKYGSLQEVGQQYKKMGVFFDAETSEWVYREWAPAAKALFLIGDFNDWNKESHPLIPQAEGYWEIRLPKGTLSHGENYKVRVLGADGSDWDRIPAWASYVIQDPVNHDFTARLWAPKEEYVWQHELDLTRVGEPFIYEAHVGMAGEEARVHSYREFADHVLPWIKKCGYNVVQLMAVQEHPYYGSFGYHVSSFFAPSSRFGSPHDLKYLIDTAHGMGIAVLLDIVHSHAVKNMAEGLNRFDGSAGQYFKASQRGTHPDWDSKCFDYGREEVLVFLLANIAWWLEEFHFDGFRFDGVTAMLYLHRGHESFGSYESYFNSSVDGQAIAYLQLANTLIKQIKPSSLSLAEDMSGMPGLCKPISEGGIGFDYRLAMGIPDFWIKMLKEKEDEEWSMGEVWHTLTNRRLGEGHIAYAESHDQALVGDKTLAFRLMDAEMYWNMDKSQKSLVIDRGMALHKMIRLASLSLGGEGWLNFMGNEFGHPEWIDFPREGNSWSHDYCRRQWSLVHNSHLRYEQLAAFDQALVNVARREGWLSQGEGHLIRCDEQHKVLIYERAGKVFVLSFSPNEALENYRFWVPSAGKWRVVFESDAFDFGGYARVSHEYIYETDSQQEISLYLLPRVGIVLEKL